MADLSFPPETIRKTLDLLGLIRDLERAEIGEVYRVASELHGLDEKDVDVLLNSLEEDRRIERLEGRYVKAKG